MTEIEAHNILNDILLRLGVKAGDCIMLGIDMGGLPLPSYPSALNRDALKERERRWCAFIYSEIIRYLGPEGTLLVPTFTYSCGHGERVYLAEDTPSENGPFTEYLRRQLGAVRSLHPIFSISGVGPNAKAILNDCGRSAFGALSPFSRFRDYNVRFVCLGVPLRRCITYIHHLEQNYGCPHRFNKAFYPTVMVNGEKIPGEWFASVGYKHLDYKSDITQLEDELYKKNLLVNAEWDGKKNQLAEICDVDAVGYELLKANSCAFMDKKLQFNFVEHDDLSSNDSFRTKMVVEAINID